MPHNGLRMVSKFFFRVTVQLLSANMGIILALFHSLCKSMKKWNLGHLVLPNAMQENA